MFGKGSMRGKGMREKSSTGSLLCILESSQFVTLIVKGGQFCQNIIHWTPMVIGYETTLKYWMKVERYPNLKEEVGGSITGCEICSLLDIKLARLSAVFCASTLTCHPFVSTTPKINNNNNLQGWSYICVTRGLVLESLRFLWRGESSTCGMFFFW